MKLLYGGLTAFRDPLLTPQSTSETEFAATCPAISCNTTECTPLGHEQGPMRGRQHQKAMPGYPCLGSICGGLQHLSCSR